MNVSYLLSRIETTQPSVSQHLNTLDRAGVLGKGRDGAQIHYRLIDERVVAICRSVCTRMAIQHDIKPPGRAYAGYTAGMPE